MIAAWMAYAILLGAAVSLAALAAERAAIAHGARVRHLWILALAITLIGPIVAHTVSARGTADALVTTRTVPEPDGAAAWLAGSAATLGIPTLLSALDRPLLIVWTAASFAMIGSQVVGLMLLARRRRAWRRTTLDGHDVLVTDDVGPAVIGVRRMRLLIPGWALGLRRESRTLMLAHESEHVRTRDPLLLATGALLVALVPWNAAAWWQLRRLRLAVEIDCDRRVLRAHPDLHAYAKLLIAVGARRSRMRLPAAALSESRSLLERRLRLMSTPRPRVPILRTIAAAGIVAVVLAVACDAPRPDPIAPSAEAASADSGAAEQNAFFDFQTDRQAAPLPGQASPRYPAILQQAAVEGTVITTFVVDAAGRTQPETFRIIESTHELFSEAVRAHVPGLSYSPALVGGRPVSMWVQQRFTFSINR